MSTALAERPQAAIAQVTADQLDLVKKTVANGATDAELKLYLYDCERQGVHPLDRLLHFTKRGGKYTPVTSIDLMRIRAAETDQYAGSDDAAFVGAVASPDFAATVTVWRLVQGQRVPFTATARWSEYCPATGSDHMWRKMPHTMLAKCAEALSLRKGFPRQLAGLYAKEELDQADVATPYVVHAPASQVTPSLPADGLHASVPNAGDSGALANDGPDLGADLPAGAARIVSCTKRAGAIELTLSSGRTHMVWKQQLQSLAEQCCQQGEPVYLEFKRSASGNEYVSAITKAKTIAATKFTGQNCERCLSDPCQCHEAF